MKNKSALVIAAAIILCVASAASASTVRDITTKVGAKVGELIKINGSLWVTKNVKIDGKLSVGGKNVVGTKRYTGTINTALSGDFVSTMSYGYDCTNGSYANYQNTTATHYKTFSISDVKISGLPDVRVYYKYLASSSIPVPATYTPTQYPNDNNVWVTATYYLANGKIYVPYKTIMTTCGGTSTNYIPTTGEYQIVIN